ncbi:UbiA family prenyltransferase [Paragemmobacter straminiformis]|uniref:UbiA family prenyltransferase n=1 Tax=Paragemmobacter straminiformis TaxID=2045119 RepID=A0A842IAS9_9RHOB|nr:UbiA family prenyltransferase [Gemmobacter straminiformis]MBC2836699.1 UbiA family prenyltransferase [Gemmobacter straminiformis]
MTSLSADCPLVVDFDATGVFVNIRHEAFFRAFVRGPSVAVYRALAGREQTPEPPATRGGMPVAEPVLDLIRQARAEGRRVLLCTTGSGRAAHAAAEWLGCIDGVIETPPPAKGQGDRAARLVAMFGEGGFDYLGTSAHDLPVWAQARTALVHSRDGTLAPRVQGARRVVQVSLAPKAGLADWVRQLRLYQWAKNLLLFAPLLAAQRASDPVAVGWLLVAFLAFGIVASSTYVLNDLIDLEADRQHARKRERPVAAGLIPVRQAAFVVPFGVWLGLSLAYVVSPVFMAVMVIYMAVTLVYSLWLKKAVLVDAICLAGLYTLRVIAGAVVIGNALSPWLLMFSLFLFLSLAYLKRYTELSSVPAARRRQMVAGRGYGPRDLTLVLALGIGAAYSSLVILALYLFSDQALRFYASPYVMVVAIPILGYWISHMWLQAMRGHMGHDPVLHSLRDRNSLVAVALFFAVFLVGAHIF